MARIEDTQYDNPTDNNSNSTSSLDFLSNLDQSLSYSIEKDVDYGYVKIRSKEGGTDQDWQDNQFSFRKIEEAIGRGIRSGCDKVFLVADNEEMAKSISGRTEWLSSFGSIVRFDAVSSSISPNQQKPSTNIPSQERVPEGEKIRKEEMRKREEKFDKYNRPKGERTREQESDDKKLEREMKLDENSKPIGQKEYDV